MDEKTINEIRDLVVKTGEEINANVEAYHKVIDKRFEALKTCMYNFLELSSSMGLSTIKANLKTI